MPTGYQIKEQDKLHFITLHVVEWVDIFSRQKYRDITLSLVTILSLNVVKAQNQADTVFKEDFETDNAWGIYEELVGGNLCYDDSIGEVSRSNEYTHDGSYGLRVWANKNLTNNSNHVIGQEKISEEGLVGKYTLSCYAFIPQEADTAQTGPEFSMQSTKNVSGTNLTFTAGIQYVQNPWANERWNIWHNGQWKPIDTSIFNFHLEKNSWYYLQLLFDNDAGAYISFSLNGSNIDTIVDLTQPFIQAPEGFKIFGENKGFEPATWITMENENLWTNCSRPVQAKIYYDNICLVKDINTAIPLLNKTKFLIYPNPATCNLIIETTIKQGYLSISDINGKEQIKKRISGNKIQIDIGNWENGVYLVKLINDTVVEERLIIKE